MQAGYGCWHDFIIWWDGSDNWLRCNTIGVNFVDVANSQSPFGTPPASPPVFEPPISTREAPGQVAAIPHAPDHGRHVTREPTPERAPAPEPPPRPRRRRRVGRIVAFVLTLAACLSVGFGLRSWNNADKPADTQSPQPSATAESVPDQRQDGDTPLLHNELFAAGSIPDGYTLTKTQQLDRCEDAASEDIAPLLESSGCSQVVRAVLSSNNSPHLVTIGVVNLDSSQSAEQAHSNIETSHETAFHSAIAPPPRSHGDTVLGFNTSGHFLLYAVVADAQEQPESNSQEQVQPIVSELVDDYLVERLQDQYN